MEFATGLKLSWKKEKSRRFGSEPWRTGDTRSLISTEITLRPVLSISMYTARSAATPWKHRLKRFALLAISTPVAARHRFCSQQPQRLGTKSSTSYKPLLIVDPQSDSLTV